MLHHTGEPGRHQAWHLAVKPIKAAAQGQALLLSPLLQSRGDGKVASMCYDAGQETKQRRLQVKLHPQDIML